MGKSLIIKGADFSANGIKENIILDVTNIFASSDSFHAQAAIGALYTAGKSANNTRCCFGATTLSSLGIDVSLFSKMEVTFKSGFDYILGTGPVPEQSSNWQGWSGEIGGQSFAWVTTNSKAIVTLDATTLAVSMNLRYHDNTTQFTASAKLTDIVQSIVLSSE